MATIWLQIRAVVEQEVPDDTVDNLAVLANEMAKKYIPCMAGWDYADGHISVAGVSRDWDTSEDN